MISILISWQETHSQNFLSVMANKTESSRKKYKKKSDGYDFPNQVGSEISRGRSDRKKHLSSQNCLSLINTSWTPRHVTEDFSGGASATQLFSPSLCLPSHFAAKLMQKEWQWARQDAIPSNYRSHNTRKEQNFLPWSWGPLAGYESPMTPLGAAH